MTIIWVGESMSNRSFLGLGGLLCTGLVAVAGCSSGDADAVTMKGKYDTAALDAYMSDASDDSPFTKSGFKPVVSKAGNDTGNVQDHSNDANVVYDGFYGDWVAKIDMDESTDDSATDDSVDPAMADFGKAMVGAMSEMFAVTLSLNEDRTFEMVMVFMPIEGKWEQKGNSLFLTPDEIMGFAGEGSEDMETMEFSIAEGGKALIAVDPETGDELVFRRK